jgi:hypothetical protein
MCWMTWGSNLCGGNVVWIHSNWPETHPAFYTRGTLSQGVRRLLHGADHPPLLASVSSMGRAIFLSPLFAYPACNGTALPVIGNKRKKEGH